MIIKVVDRKTREKSHFERLGRYILNAKTDDSVLFKRTAEYVIDIKGAGEKVGWYRVSNCQSDMPAAAIAEVLATQAENQRAKSDKTYHVVVSLPQTESLTREQAADIEDAICAGLGFAGHQRISAVHRDTDNFHLHIAVNKIHPTTFRCVDPYYPYYKLDALAKELELKHGLQQDNRIGKEKSFANVGQMESQQREESFLRWLHEHLGNEIDGVLQTAEGWQEIHAMFVAHGAIIKPRGAGLAIVTYDGKVGIKASSLDRRLSFKALTDRFGDYEPPKLQGVAGKQYQRDAKEQAGASRSYTDYQATRQSNYQSRSAAMKNLRIEYSEHRSDIKERYRRRRASVKANTEMDNRTKRSAYHELSQQMKKELVELSKRQDRQRRAIREQFPALTWDEYLVNQATQGNTEALTILRRRNECRRQMSEALLTVDNLADARDIIMPYFKPTVMKDGKVIYRARDGGVVFDEATAISVHQVTEAATALALSLADERFHGKALVVEGCEKFKVQVARLAALEGLSIRFADPGLEQGRQRQILANQFAQQEVTDNSHQKSRPLVPPLRRDYSGR